MPDGLSSGPQPPDPFAQVEVFRTPFAAALRERALVLQALGIEHVSVTAGGEQVLLVAARDARTALEQLRRFELENAATAQADDRLEIRAGFRAGALCWALALIALYVGERLDALDLPWWAAGEARATAIRGGELWRVVTALGLHADLAHLAGNLAFGVLFVGVVCQSVGVGTGLLLTVLSGALGNLAAAALRDGGSSVGASTAVFGALGLLAALQWRRRRRQRSGALRRWTPVVAAALLLGYLGAAGSHVDVLAHVTGFGCGLALGALCEPLIARARNGRRAQGVQGLLAAALVTGAWVVALARG